MNPNHELNDRDYAAIEEALAYTLIDGYDEQRQPPRRDLETALSKVRRLMGLPIRGGAEGVHVWMKDAQALWEESQGAMPSS